MPIPEDLLKQMKCSLSDDGHIVHEPILLKCGANACKQCVNGSSDLMIKCFSCNGKHVKKDLLDSPTVKITVVLIQSFINDLFLDLKTKLESCSLLLKGLKKILFDTFSTLFLNLFSSPKRNQ
jgi:hypothetical protein